MAVNHTFLPPESAPLDPGGSRKKAPKLLMAEFGDGYSQRAADGINNDPRTRSMSWTNLTQEEKDYIDGFLEDRNGFESFFYQERDEPQPKVFICTEWEVVDVTYDVYTVTATFKQVYDL